MLSMFPRNARTKGQCLLPENLMCLTEMMKKMSCFTSWKNEAFIYTLYKEPSYDIQWQENM